MKRSKENVKYWDNRSKKLFLLDPKYKSAKFRYEAIMLILREKYPQIKELPSIETILKDAIYIDRRVRLLTENEEKQIKIEMSQEWQLEHGYGPLVIK